MLDPVRTRLKDVQKDIKKLLPPDAILVGQSIENDLRSLKVMCHIILRHSIMYLYCWPTSWTFDSVISVVLLQSIENDLRSLKVKRHIIFTHDIGMANILDISLSQCSTFAVNRKWSEITQGKASFYLFTSHNASGLVANILDIWLSCVVLLHVESEDFGYLPPSHLGALWDTSKRSIVNGHGRCYCKAW